MARRIAFLLPAHWSARMGGSQYQAKVLIEHLLESYDAEVHYLTVQSDPSQQPAGYRIHRFSDVGGIRRYGHFFDALRLYRALQRVRPDVIYQQVGCAHTGIAALYARRHGVRLVWRVSSDRNVAPARTSWWQVNRRIERRMLDYGIRHAHLILAQTTYQRAALAERYGRDDAVVVGNFHPDAAQREIAPPGRRIRRRVVWVGNLKPLKNPYAFLRLADALREEDVRFVVIGASVVHDRWTERLLADIRHAPNIEYLGERTQDEVNREIGAATLLVNTSDFEGFSNTFIQAWLREVPVVSLRVDPDGLLADRGLGCLSGTEERLAHDVRRLLCAPEDAAAMGQRCRDYALAHHSMRNVDELARLLQVERRHPFQSAAGTAAAAAGGMDVAAPRAVGAAGEGGHA